MHQTYIYSRTTVVSTTCGTILSVFSNITSEEIAQTIVLAAIGAAVSFTVSVFLRWSLRKLFRKNK